MLYYLFLIEPQAEKDFGKENYHKIKEIQKANREKQKESARGEPMKAVYKPGKFDHVESKVAEKIQVLYFHCFIKLLFEESFECMQ